VSCGVVRWRLQCPPSIVMRRSAIFMGHALGVMSGLVACGGNAPTRPETSTDAGNCDPLAQTGCAASEKCTYTRASPQPQCRPTGIVPAGGDCSIDSSDDDDCVRGSTCTRTALADSDPNAPVPHAVCRAYCADDTDCTASGSGSARCETVATSRRAGLCVDACTPFGVDCAPTGTCAGKRLDIDGRTEFMVCHFVGAGTDGSMCANETECGSDLICEGTVPFRTNGICKRLCDATHSCASGTSCSTACPDVGRVIGNARLGGPRRWHGSIMRIALRGRTIERPYQLAGNG